MKVRLLHHFLSCIASLACVISLTAADSPFTRGKWIDLTHDFSTNTLYWPTAQKFVSEVEFHAHTDKGYFYAANRYSASEHGGTHIDAPIHFAERGKTLDQLTGLAGIGRKSANVIMRESGVKAEGIIVDLHVVRVAPRLGIASGTDPKKLEKQMMELLLPEQWGEAGMAISFLGREICRPSNPKCPECLMKKVCDFYLNGGPALKVPKKTKKSK